MRGADGGTLRDPGAKSGVVCGGFGRTLAHVLRLDILLGGRSLSVTPKSNPTTYQGTPRRGQGGWIPALILAVAMAVTRPGSAHQLCNLPKRHYVLGLTLGAQLQPKTLNVLVSLVT